MRDTILWRLRAQECAWIDCDTKYEWISDMKITKSQLKQIIKEELEEVLNEDSFDQIRSESSLRGKILDQMLKMLPKPPEKARNIGYPQEFFGSVLSPLRQQLQARVKQDKYAESIYDPLIGIASAVFRETQMGDPDEKLSFNTHWDKPPVQKYLIAAATKLANYLEHGKYDQGYNA